MFENKTFKSKISFNIESNHPDIQYVKNPNDELHFEDIYTMPNHLNSEEDMISFIKHDLSLVASGGYSTEYIRNVKFDIKKI